MPTYKLIGNDLVTTTRREVQERRVVVTRTKDGDLVVTAHASGYDDLAYKDIQCVKHAKSWGDSVWLGGAVVWTYLDDGTTETWTSETVITENGGARFSAEELEYIRLHWRVMGADDNQRKRRKGNV